MEYKLSSTGIENFLADYVLSAEIISGNSRIAQNSSSALVWYVSTGRADTEFIKSLLCCKPSEIAKISLKGGTYDETINRIKRFVKKH